MRIITAPEPYEDADDIKVFLAGGITGCENWQSEVLDIISRKLENNMYFPNNIVFFNPRREVFQVDNKNLTTEQIEWEFNMLQKADIFSMYFSAQQIQPICLYELGRNLLNMKIRFPDTYLSRICITCPKEYERANDVYIQTSLALFGNTTEFQPDKYCYYDGKISSITHAQLILNCILAISLGLTKRTKNDENTI